MRAFIETIKGNSYSIEEAKQLFIDYTLRHKGNVNEKLRKARVEIYQGCLPNGKRAHADTNIKQNIIRMVAGKNSIITFFHELKHLADGWKDSEGIWHTNWGYEDDYSAQMIWSNQQNKEVNIKRGIKGLAMSEATAELFASKIYWELCSNSPESKAYTANTRKYYDEEIIFLKKICLVLGVSEDTVLSWRSEENFGREQLRKLFAKLTGLNDFFDKLEYRMDYVSMLKFIYTTHPDFKVNPISLNNVELYRRNINELLQTCMRYKFQERYYMSLGASKSEFEQIYNKKQEEFKLLDAYLSHNSPNGEHR